MVRIVVTGSEFYSGGGEKTVAKLVILEKYIQAYLTVMDSQWRGENWYVDTHSGTGFSEEFGVPLPGSTLRALSHDFDRYYFYEEDDEHFEILCDVIESDLDVHLWKNLEPDEGPPRAGCEDPYLQIANTDCNDGVIWLIENANSHAHWFTFVDPERMSASLELMATLLRRGNMDILLNFQTDAYLRNATTGADHSHDKVDNSLPDGWPVDADADEYVEFYKEEVFEEQGWMARSETMVSEGSNGWRYDLIFGSENATAIKIIGDIMGKSVKQDVFDEIEYYRENGSGQSSLADLHIEGVEGDDAAGQSSLGQFQEY